MGIIVCAFPGCGKTFAAEQLELKDYKLLDSDTSTWEKVEGWEEKYVDSVEENLKHYDIVFAPMHNNLRKIFQERNLPFVVVSPHYGDNEREHLLIKQQWFGRLALRDNSFLGERLQSWWEMMVKNYDGWVSMKNLGLYNPKHIILLNQNEYLGDTHILSQLLK